MNGKKAKRIRRETNKKIVEHVKTNILEQDQWEGRSDKELLAVVPYRSYFRKQFSYYNGITTKRWFYLQAKRNEKERCTNR